MSDFISINEALENKKGSFIGTVIHTGDLKSGTTKDGRDWTMKVFSLKDNTGHTEIATFNDEIKLFELDCTYEITPWYKCHDGKLSLAIGKFGIVKKIASVSQQQTIGASKEYTSNESTAATNIPEIGEVLKKFTLDENLTISQISKIVKEQVQNEPNPPTESVIGSVVWVRTKEIYTQWKLSRSEKQ